MIAIVCLSLLWLTLAVAAASAAGSQNTFPPELRGTFVSNKYGQLMFGEDFVDGISLIYQHCGTCGEDRQSFKFDLMERNDTRYLLRSDVLLHGGKNKSNIWMCWYLTAVTPTKWKFFQAPLRKHEQFFDYVSIVKETTCELSAVVPISRLNILLSTKTGSTLSVACPQSLQGSYEIIPYVNSCTMEMDIVNETIAIRNPQCHVFTSLDRNMSCVHYEGDGEGRWYVLALGPRNVSHWKFICMVFLKNGSKIPMTHQYSTCEDVNPPNFTTYQHLLSNRQEADTEHNATTRVRKRKNPLYSKPFLLSVIILLSSLPLVLLFIRFLNRKKHNPSAAPKSGTALEEVETVERVGNIQ